MYDKELKKKANAISSMISIGKSGITDTFIKSVDNYLKANKIVKIKCQTAVGRDEVVKFADEVSSKTNSNVVDVKGFTFTIYREE